MDANSPFNYMQPVAANPFDQFDAPAPTGLSPRYAGVFGPNAVVVQTAPAAPQANPFDQFDTPAKAGADGAVGAGVRGFLNGATFNLSDPAVAALQATFGDPTNPTSNADDWQTRYHEDLAGLRGVNAENQDAHPLAAFSGDLAGTFANPANRLLPAVNSAADAVRVGGQLGLAYGLGSGVEADKSIDDTVDQGIWGALGGAATGGVLSRVGDAAAAALEPRTALTIAALKSAAKAAYGRLENAGVSISPVALNRMGDAATAKFGSVLGDPEISAALYPKASAALRLVGSYGADGARGDVPATLSSLDQMRRVVADAAQATEPADRYLARQILDHVDDSVGSLRPTDLVQTGDTAAAGYQPADAVSDLTTARDLWRRAAKASTLQGIIDKAQSNSTGFAQSGFENALRSGFRKLLNNPRGISRFTPDEQAAIKQVATGGGALSATNMLRNVGKLSPQGALPLLGEVGLVTSAGPGALAVPAAGLAGRLGATALQKAAANRAVDLAAIGPAGAAAVGVAPAVASGLRLRAIRAVQSLPKLTPAAVALPLTANR